MIASRCPACGCEFERCGEAACPRCGRAVARDTGHPTGQSTVPPDGGATFIGGPLASTAPEARFSFLSPTRGEGELGWLGHYKVLRLLGEGGMGLVFLAEDTGLGRHVALKVLRPEMAREAGLCQRFLREARMTAAVHDHHIVTIHQVGQDNGVTYLAMELLEGEPLESRVQREGRLDVPEALRIGREAALGLAAAHERGLIHRDIKPTNLFLEGPGGHVKILDFGLARTADGPSDLSQPGMVMGTPDYMSPEQAKGMEVSSRTDLFSLGCVLYRMLSGEKPFGDGGTLVVAWAVQLKHPTPLIEANPALPPALSELVSRLLAKEPEDRPATAREVAEALESIASGVSGQGPGARESKRSFPVAMAALAGVLFLGLCVGGYFLWRGPGNGQAGNSGGKDGKPAAKEPRPVKFTLNGGGSTFIYPLMEAWSEAYREESGVKVNYLSIGSGRGLKQLLAGEVDFACTEAPLPEGLAKEAGEVLYVPLALGAVVPAYNLEGVAGLRLTGAVLAGIYSGAITKWNDPTTAEVNEGVTLPDRKIVVVHRSDPSGTTHVFTDFLSKAAKGWKPSATMKPPGGVGAPGNEGVLEEVAKRPGAIGYIDLRHALQAKAPFASVKNRGGQFVKATLEAVTATAEGVADELPAGEHFTLTHQSGREVYPICGCTFAVLHGKQPEGKGRRAVEFLRWVVTGGQGKNNGLDYARLPKALADKVVKALAKVKIGGAD